MKRRLNLWLVRRLLGPDQGLDQEVQDTWARIWPKHPHYDAANRIIIRDALAHSYYRGRLAEIK